MIVLVIISLCLLHAFGSQQWLCCVSREKLQAELAALQGAQQDLELGHAILIDKLKQSKAENDRLLQEVENFKARITNATQDYVGTAPFGWPPTVHIQCAF